MKNKFYIGSEIVGRKTGFPGVGRICGIIMGGAIHASKLQQTGTGYDRWDELFPGWQNKFAYFVWYNEPRKQSTFEELKYDSRFVDYTQYELEEYYEKCPSLQMITYVGDDLEFFDKELDEVDKIIEQVT